MPLYLLSGNEDYIKSFKQYVQQLMHQGAFVILVDSREEHIRCNSYFTIFAMARRTFLQPFLMVRVLDRNRIFTVQ